jgi:hypothetical protein
LKKWRENLNDAQIELFLDPKLMDTPQMTKKQTNKLLHLKVTLAQNRIRYAILEN